MISTHTSYLTRINRAVRIAILGQTSPSYGTIMYNQVIVMELQWMIRIFQTSKPSHSHIIWNSFQSIMFNMEHFTGETTVCRDAQRVTGVPPYKPVLHLQLSTEHK